MLKILAAILHLGNVSFQEGRDDSSRLDHKEFLDTACSLLGSNMAELSRSFLERTFTAGGGEVVTTPLTKAKAENSRVNILSCSIMNALLTSYLFKGLLFDALI